jgi:hypothetical protein
VFGHWRFAVDGVILSTERLSLVLEKCGFERIGAVIDPEDGQVWRWERPKEGPDRTTG